MNQSMNQLIWNFERYMRWVHILMLKFNNKLLFSFLFTNNNRQYVYFEVLVSKNKSETLYFSPCRSINSKYNTSQSSFTSRQTRNPIDLLLMQI